MYLKFAVVSSNSILTNQRPRKHLLQIAPRYSRSDTGLRSTIKGFLMPTFFPFFTNLPIAQTGHFTTCTSHERYDVLTHWGRDKWTPFRRRQFQMHFLNENIWISITISMKFVPMGPINNIPTMVQIMAGRRPGDKPLSEPMVVSLPSHICVARPQWVKSLATDYLLDSLLSEPAQHYWFSQRANDAESVSKSLCHHDDQGRCIQMGNLEMQNYIIPMKIIPCTRVYTEYKV